MDNLLDLDPDLLEGADALELHGVPDLLPVRTVRVPVGTWNPEELRDVAYLGVLIREGRLAGRVGVGGRRHVEVLGPGDFGQPWVDNAIAASIPGTPEWRVLQELEIAILDRRFAALAGRWPVLTRVLLERLVQRSRRLVFQLAVLSVPQIATRIELMLWHFGDRWGRMTPNGVLLELPVSHEVLAQVVGSQRPSVTTALSDLRRRGRVERRRDGCWVLCGPPPAGLAPLYGQAGIAPAARVADLTLSRL
jgi:CRP/FNR family cyclic AMP-dependent transcriptional regulator